MFDMTNMKQHLKTLPDKYQKALYAYAETAAKDCEKYAKQNRRWTDRTAHARQRLQGYAEQEPGKVRVCLSHGVDYGIYLEYGFEKKYAIIHPTLRKKGADIINGARKLLK